MFDIDSILVKSDLLAYVEAAGGKPKGHGDRYACACPLHGGDNPTAFSVFRKDGKLLWNCFTGDCGGGDAITFVELWQFSNIIDKKERFKRACEWIGGGAIADPEALRESAERRLAQAEAEARAAKEREEARREELRTAERHVYYHKMMPEWARAMWRKRGIDDGMQDFWTLGACEDFVIDGGYHTPTLTIPVVNRQRELMTIRHRLINPRSPKDKYRPETSGLHAHPFFALPEMGYDGGLIWVMEGEVKAMVTWTISDTDWQCIGVPGQEMYSHLVPELAGKNVIVVPDPGAEKNAIEFAKKTGGRMLFIREKLDDLILETGADKNYLYALSKQTRRV